MQEQKITKFCFLELPRLTAPTFYIWLIRMINLNYIKPKDAYFSEFFINNTKIYCLFFDRGFSLKYKTLSERYFYSL